jgi:hypothetical protein
LSRVFCINKLNFNPEVTVNANALKAGLIGFMVAGTFLTQAFTWPLYIILSLTIALEKLTIDSNKDSSYGDPTKVLAKK